MKRAAVVAGIALVAVLLCAGASFAIEPGRLVANRAFIIDFGAYETRMSNTIQENMAEWQKNQKDKKVKTGSPLEHSNFQMSPRDWMLDRWEVELNSSASSVLNNVLSYVTNVNSSNWATAHESYKGQRIQGYDENVSKFYTQDGNKGASVLGARIHFPHHRHNCWAKIKPPFELSAYSHSKKPANEFNGVVYNVGQIKSVSVWVKGRNYPYNLAVRLKDRDGVVREYYFSDPLAFDNWRLLTWVNPNYIENPRDRLLTRLPLYPKSMPYVKFMCFVIYRQMDQIGGDFVIYIRDLKIEYDKAIDDSDKKDIDDESVWGILKARQAKDRKREMLRLSEKKALLERERRKLENIKTTSP